MARLEILDVVRSPIDTKLLWGWALDLPVPAETREHYAFVIGGWVLHRDTDRLDVEVTCRDRLVARWRADLQRSDVAAAFHDAPVSPACGFLGAVSTVHLPRRFELKVEVVDRHSRMLLATILGRRSALIMEPGPGLRPAPVVTLGRTGSTLLMQLLAQNPQVVVHPPFPFEARILSYWASIVEEISSPHSYLQALASVDTSRYWWVGHGTFRAEACLDLDIAAQHLGGAAIESLASFARRQVRGFYEVVAAHLGRAETAVCFAEKQLPLPAVRTIQDELFPERREIYLVRDFRDMLASIVAFNHKRGYTSFGRDLLAGDDEYLAAQGRAVAQLLQARRAVGANALLIRYEDLVREPRKVLAELLGFLDLHGSGETVAGMIAGAEASDAAARESHRTEGDAEASIGRWKRDLSPDLAARSSETFAEALEAWGYIS